MDNSKLCIKRVDWGLRAELDEECIRFERTAVEMHEFIISFLKKNCGLSHNDARSRVNEAFPGLKDSDEVFIQI